MHHLALENANRAVERKWHCFAARYLCLTFSPLIWCLQQAGVLRGNSMESSVDCLRAQQPRLSASTQIASRVARLELHCFLVAMVEQARLVAILLSNQEVNSFFHTSMAIAQNSIHPLMIHMLKQIGIHFSFSLGKIYAPWRIHRQLGLPSSDMLCSYWSLRRWDSAFKIHLSPSLLSSQNGSISTDPSTGTKDRKYNHAKRLATIRNAKAEGLNRSEHT